jgi:hypothetical protein
VILSNPKLICRSSCTITTLTKQSRLLRPAPALTTPVSKFPIAPRVGKRVSQNWAFSIRLSATWAFDVSVLVFRDPDNIQLELFAEHQSASS